jgi:ribosomal-protein-alanine N-acetyltransferase
VSETSGPGLALETATDHVSVAVLTNGGAPGAHVVEESVGHGHTRRLSAIVAAALATAGVHARDLGWIAADLGPGSFTGVRVGLATARALALASDARLLGASSLTALAHAAGTQRSLVLPLVGAGRRDLYLGFYRSDAQGRVHLLAAPRVGPPDELLEAVAEAHAVVGDLAVRFVGPGAGRERDRLEAAWPGSTASAFRHDGLSALDLATAVRVDGGPGEGLPAPGHETEPAYVRPAQAEERVRHQVMGLRPPGIRTLTLADLPIVQELEHHLFSDPWPPSFFLEALTDPDAVTLVAVRDGEVAGYLVASLLPPEGELQNLATAHAHQRGGIARALMLELLAICRAREVEELRLEVRVSNAAAQNLYRSLGFRLVGLRRGYYKAPVEDAILMGLRFD